MTDTNTESPAKADEPKKSQPAPLSYTVERLINDSEGFLGVARHVAVGALNGTSKPMTLDQAQKRVAEWLAKPENK